VRVPTRADTGGPRCKATKALAFELTTKNYFLLDFINKRATYKNIIYLFCQKKTLFFIRFYKQKGHVRQKRFIYQNLF